MILCGCAWCKFLCPPLCVCARRETCEGCPQSTVSLLVQGKYSAAELRYLAVDYFIFPHIKTTEPSQLTTTQQLAHAILHLGYQS